jgi:hypothetical protein
VGGCAAHGPGRTARVFRPGDPDGADAQGRVPAGLPADRGLVGSVIGLLGLELAAPDHSTLCRRAETLEVPRPKPRGAGAGAGDSDDAGGGAEPLRLLIDSTGLKLYGAGEWRVEKHGTQRRQS